MSGPVRDWIAAELAGIVRTKSPPTGPLGFGYDLYCADDLRADMLEVDGVANPTLLLALAIRRRLDCPRGALPDDPEYGIDLRGYLNRGTPAQEIRVLAGRIRTELQKDDRIDRVTITVTPSPNGSSLAVGVHVVPQDHRLGGFELILAVTSAAVLIDEIRRAS